MSDSQQPAWSVKGDIGEDLLEQVPSVPGSHIWNRAVSSWIKASCWYCMWLHSFVEHHKLDELPMPIDLRHLHGWRKWHRSYSARAQGQMAQILSYKIKYYQLPYRKFELDTTPRKYTHSLAADICFFLWDYISIRTTPWSINLSPELSCSEMCTCSGRWTIARKA